MFEEVKVLTHSSIKISGEKILYFDPFEVRKETHDADVIFITHDHYDHYSPEDIQKIMKADTLFVMPESMRGQEEKAGIREVRFLSPGGTLYEGGLTVKATPAYNRLKPFHVKSKKYVGYLVTMGEVSYYVAGDTDALSENEDLICDVALVPVGGKYTMDYQEAAKFVNKVTPKLAIPTHYGPVGGTLEDGKKFAELVDRIVEVRVMI